MRRLRRASIASILVAIALMVLSGASQHGSKAPAVAEKGKEAVLRVVGAVKGVMKKATSESNPFTDPILFIVGLLTLVSACLGAFTLLRGSKMTRWRLLR
jgi:hypothetical protein